jgi:glycerol-3-phosphate acyltransferase PlsX
MLVTARDLFIRRFGLIKIAVDAMGGDHAPHDVVRGAIEAARQSKGRFEIVLVGDEPTVQREISHHFHVDDLPLSIIAAKESVDMDELPSVSLKKKDSSIAVMMNMHRDHKVDAVRQCRATQVR